MLNFIIEQLRLLHVPKQGRRYSSAMTTTAFLWQLTSTSLYKKLCDFFILPCISTLRKFSSPCAVESGNLNIDYLKQRASTLTDNEKLVILMIDEIYTAQRIEYSNGAFNGLTEEGLPAKLFSLS